MGNREGKGQSSSRQSRDVSRKLDTCKSKTRRIIKFIFNIFGQRKLSREDWRIFFCIVICFPSIRIVVLDTVVKIGMLDVLDFPGVFLASSDQACFSSPKEAATMGPSSVGASQRPPPLARHWILASRFERPGGIPPKGPARVRGACQARNPENGELQRRASSGGRGEGKVSTAPSVSICCSCCVHGGGGAKVWLLGGHHVEPHRNEQDRAAPNKSVAQRSGSHLVARCVWKSGIVIPC